MEKCVTLTESNTHTHTQIFKMREIKLRLCFKLIKNKNEI